MLLVLPTPLTKRCIGMASTAAYFAMWAIRQSPYGWPDDLQEALSQFRTAIAAKFWAVEDCSMGASHLTRQQLRDIVYSSICEIPTCRVWNTPKANPGAEFVFVSSFTRNHPDHDLIDLDALAGNITKSTWDEHSEY